MFALFSVLFLNPLRMTLWTHFFYGRWAHFGVILDVFLALLFSTFLYTFLHASALSHWPP